MAANILAPPLVSAVVPAYNAERYLAQTLSALVTQCYANVEIIVGDDGSEDKTLQIAQTITREYSQVRVFHQSKQGVAAARN
jgi:glycosyltransferase involved in cell wall biosynthesis